jgi:hypothetical protein
MSNVHESEVKDENIRVSPLIPIREYAEWEQE